MDNYEVIAGQLLSIMPQIRCLSKSKVHLHKLTMGEGFMLGALKYNDGHMMAGEMAKLMDVSTARIATICNSLEQRGLIERRSVSGDRRKCEIFLSPAGDKEATKNYDDIIKNMTQLLRTLGENDAQALLNISEKLLKIMKEDV